MRNIRCNLILLVGLAVLTCSIPSEAQKPRAERPTYALGDKWIRQDGVYDLIRIEKDLYIFAAGPGQEIHLTKDLAVQKMLRGGQAEWEFYPPPKLGWPLEVGKWGKTNGSLKLASGPRFAAITWIVEAYEDIQVSAGVFKAFRITMRLETGYGPMLLQRGEFVTWYAPEARQLVKAENRDFGSCQLQQYDLVRRSQP